MGATADGDALGAADELAGREGFGLSEPQPVSTRTSGVTAPTRTVLRRITRFLPARDLTGRYLPDPPRAHPRGRICGQLLHVDEVHHEDQRLTRPDDTTSTTVAVREVWRDDQLAAAADLHALHALVPAGDDLSDA